MAAEIHNGKKPILCTCPANPLAVNPRVRHVYYQGKTTEPRFVWVANEDGNAEDDDDDVSEALKAGKESDSEVTPSPRPRTRSAKTPKMMPLYTDESDEDSKPPSALEICKHRGSPPTIHLSNTDSDSKPPSKHSRASSDVVIIASSSPPDAKPSGKRKKGPNDFTSNAKKAKTSKRAGKMVGKGKKRAVDRSRSVLTDTGSDNEEDAPLTTEQPCAKPKPQAKTSKQAGKMASKGKKRAVGKSRSVLTDTGSDHEEDAPLTTERPRAKPKPLFTQPANVEVGAAPLPPPSTSSNTQDVGPSKASTIPRQDSRTACIIPLRQEVHEGQPSHPAPSPAPAHPPLGPPAQHREAQPSGPLFQHYEVQPPPSPPAQPHEAHHPPGPPAHHREVHPRRQEAHEDQRSHPAPSPAPAHPPPGPPAQHREAQPSGPPAQQAHLAHLPAPGPPFVHPEVQRLHPAPTLPAHPQPGRLASLGHSHDDTFPKALNPPLRPRDDSNQAIQVLDDQYGIPLLSVNHREAQPSQTSTQLGSRGHQPLVQGGGIQGQIVYDQLGNTYLFHQNTYTRIQIGNLNPRS